MVAKRIKAALSKLANMTKIKKKRLRIVRASGRANLIGEHTDYNEGYVLPCTVNKEMIVAVLVCDGRTFGKPFKEDARHTKSKIIR